MPSKPRSDTGAPATNSLESSAPYRITIAEDDENFLFLMHHFISRAFPGAGIAMFSNAEDTLRHILDTGTDILITDHALGAMSGTDLIRELRARGLTIPILMLSGNPDAERGALLAGATEYLDKSVSFDGIADRLRRLLSARTIAQPSAVTNVATS